MRPEPPVSPPLPPADTVGVPGRGEVFFRSIDGPADAPTVLLLHGWTTSADLTWCWAYEPLGRVARVLAPDHRGHGRGIRTREPFTLEDAADDVAGLLRQLGAGPVIVCGYSMGGPIGLLLWRRHPELVAGLVLEATALEWEESAAERAVWRAMGLFERVMRSSRSDGIVRRLLRPLLERCPELEPHRGWLEGELRRGDPQALAEAGRALGHFHGAAFAGDIDVPAAVVVTARDELVRPSKQRAMAAAIPGAATFEVDADHDACLAARDDFVGVTLRAVADVAERVGTTGDVPVVESG